MQICISQLEEQLRQTWERAFALDAERDRETGGYQTFWVSQPLQWKSTPKAREVTRRWAERDRRLVYLIEMELARVRRCHANIELLRHRLHQLWI